MSQQNVVKFICSCALIMQDEATTICDLLLIFISLIASYYIDLRFPRLSSASTPSFNLIHLFIQFINVEIKVVASMRLS